MWLTRFSEKVVYKNCYLYQSIRNNVNKKHIWLKCQQSRPPHQSSYESIKSKHTKCRQAARHDLLWNTMYDTKRITFRTVRYDTYESNRSSNEYKVLVTSDKSNEYIRVAFFIDTTHLYLLLNSDKNKSNFKLHLRN